MQRKMFLDAPAQSEPGPDVRPSGPFAMGAVFAGIVAGINNIGICIALATLMFAGPLAGGLGIAASAALLASAIVALALSAGSGLRGNLGQAQDIGVAVLAPTLAALALTRDLAPETLLATAFAVVAMASLATGAFMVLVGRLGLGSMVRFFPQTVIAGFLAGTGWLLAVGGIAVAANLSMENLFEPSAWSGEALARIAPVIGFALALRLVLPRVAHPAALVIMLLAAVAGFHGLLWTTGMNVATAQGWGWLPPTPATGSLTNLPRLLPLVDWSAVTATAPVVGIVAVLNLLACLMNTTALEAVTGKDTDHNAELRVTGLANIACALAAGPPGYCGLSDSLIAHRISPGSRMAGLVMAGVVVLALFAAGSLVTIIPVFVTSGLLVYLGVDLLRDWLIATRRRYGTAEWGIVVAIVVVVAVAGFVPALIVGLGVGSALFVYSYAQVQVVRRVRTLDRLRSTLERDPIQTAMLREKGATVAVFELQGFLFFGTAERLRAQVKKRLADPASPPLRRLILDFGHVSGLDSAASTLIERIAAMTAERGIELVLSQPRPAVASALRRASPDLLRAAHVRWAACAGEAIEAAEEMLLGAPARTVGPAGIAARHGLLDEDAARLTAFFERFPVERLRAGSRLLAEGEPANGIVLLEEGRVAVLRRGDGGGPPQRVRAMAAGVIIGEIGIATGTGRTADVVAETEIVVRRIPSSVIARLEHEDATLALGLSRVVMRALAEKVITANRIAEDRPD